MANQFLVKETMEAMRGLSAAEITALQDGTYEGVQLLGYYEKGDTPGPIVYYLTINDEEHNGITIISGINYKLYHDFGGHLNVLYAGASPNLNKAENKSIIENSIIALDNQGGGQVFIPATINYGYRRQYINTHPQQLQELVNDIIVFDESIGNSYTSNPLIQRDGAQTRKFYLVKGDVTNGQSDGQGDIIRGDWHPYILISNDKDPLTAVRRHATVFFGYNGEAIWGIGQGILSDNNTGSNRDLQMADFKLVCSKIEGASGLTTMMSVKLLTGRFGFNTSSPTADFHFNTMRNTGTNNGSFLIENPKGGNIAMLLKTAAKTRNISLSNNTGDISITNDSGLSNVFRIKSNGSLQLGTVSLLIGNGDPNGFQTAKIGSLYLREDASANNTGLYIKSQDSGNSGWTQVLTSSSSTISPSGNGLQIGSYYFNTTEGLPKFWNGTNWVNSAPNATTSVKGIMNQAAASPDSTIIPSETYSQSEMLSILTELRDLKNKMRSAGILAN